MLSKFNFGIFERLGKVFKIKYVQRLAAFLRQMERQSDYFRNSEQPSNEVIFSPENDTDVIDFELNVYRISDCQS